MKKSIIYTIFISTFVFISTLFISQPAHAAYCDQYGCKRDYSYECYQFRSERIYKFNGNGFDIYGTQSRCYKKTLNDVQVVDNQFVYDQFGYDIYGIDQNGRDERGVCITGKCQTYHYYQPYYRSPSQSNYSRYESVKNYSRYYRYRYNAPKYSYR